ncbi:MAG: dTDP-glucose 4,6-dehydratase [Acidobacteriota bacterium]
MKVLITGGCGFIGANFIHYLLRKRPSFKIINFDLLTYSGNPENLKSVEKHPGYRFVRGDIADKKTVSAIFSERIDAVVNFAAESHVDRSIEDADPFLRTNVIGSQNLMEEARRRKIDRFIHISTDEVYGSIAGRKKFGEDHPMAPSSPYSASKAAADLIARAYFKTYRLPIIITRSSNNYGPYQFPEKFIPLMVTNAFQGKPLPIYGDGLYVRDWLYVEDNCEAILKVLEEGKEGEVYNIGGGCERKNIDVAKKILKITGRDESLLKHVADRPGHDRRYAIDFSKIIKETGWEPAVKFEEGLKRTIAWYRQNETWWRRIISGDYLVARREAYRRFKD